MEVVGWVVLCLLVVDLLAVTVLMKVVNDATREGRLQSMSVNSRLKYLEYRRAMYLEGRRK